MLKHLDLVVFHFFNQTAGHSPVLDRLMILLAENHMLSSVLLMSFIWYLWFNSDGSEQMHMLSEAAGLVLAGPLSRGLQRFLPFHLRPIHDPLSGIHMAIGANPNELSHWSSFPSDHAAVYFALATVIFLHSRRLGVLSFLWAAVMIFPRVYLGYHWPTDIVAGAALGIIMVLLGRRFFPRTFAAWFMQCKENAPAYFYSCAFLFSYLVTTLYTELRELVGALR